MALNDIVNYDSNAAVLDFSRGNIGAAADSVFSGFAEQLTPLITLGGAVFPAVGDVDLSAPTYGPNGNDYVGTLKQPAKADVKNGVQYGASGTEFTGELVGGSGGNIFVICD